MLDVGCLAWLADMSWQYYQHTADTSHLRTITWPLLRGTLASYQRMFKDTVVDGRPAKVLPYSVSPEWRGSQVSSVGRNSSYQLAAVHATLRNLSLAAQELGMPQDPLWQQLSATELHLLFNAEEASLDFLRRRLQTASADRNQHQKIA
jgi:hypothetical protein